MNNTRLIKWIPTSEKLPIDDGLEEHQVSERCLVTVMGDDGKPTVADVVCKLVKYINDYENSFICEWCFDDDLAYAYELDDVIAWAYLPEPYVGD